jgi:hypothetical protein
MSASLRLLWVSGILIFCFGSISGTPVSTNQPTGFRLIIELQDGSKIIGKNGDDNFQFRSDVLGEMKLPLERIRSIACQPKTNSVQLATVNGDTLTAQFVTKVVRVETAFGNFKLPGNLIKHVQVSPMGKEGQTRPGLMALWSAEGNAHDLINGNHGILLGEISFVEGVQGKAFLFNGVNQYVKIPASAKLDVGSGNGLTIELWVNPSNLDLRPLVEWDSNQGMGAHLWLSTGAVSPGVGNLYANLKDIAGNDHYIFSEDGLITANHFQHVALTYDKTTGMAALYRNGVEVANQNLGIFTPQTSSDLYFGIRVAGPFSGLYFKGKMDEVSIYNRALATEEIQADYEAGHNGND